MRWASLIVVGVISWAAAVVTSQQSYSPSVCRNTTSARGYSCNGLLKSCHTYLLFRAQPPYNNASSIASLLNSDPSQIALLNNISQSSVLVTRAEVIVPINCSCSGSYYQSNTSYVVRAYDTPYLIANATFEGSTTCSAIKHQWSGLVDAIFPHQILTIPLRCACPTKNQSLSGIKYLMTYVIKPGDAISTISLRFGVNDVGETLVANQKSLEDSLIQPFTTLLVPLRTPPNSSMTITPPPGPPSPPSPPPAQNQTLSNSNSNSNSKKWNYFLYGLIAGGGFVMLFGSIAIYLFARRRGSVMSSATEENPIANKSHDAEIDIEPLELLDSISKVAQSLIVYSFKDLQSATDDFSSNSLITGSVYRGVVSDGQSEQRQLAIKKTEGDVTQEIEILNKLNHFNITTLVGICYNNGLWYMVYEYAANGRLSDWVYQSRGLLSWERRVQIAMDVATGLDYLHGYTNPPRIHKDLKCSHVLLDGDFRAKISHLGQSKSVGGEEAAGHFALTNHIVGTRGYMAPEYLENGLVTPKMDVYAFGILVVEMLSGREVAAVAGESDCVALSAVLEAVLGEDSDGGKKLRELMDPSLEEGYPSDVAKALVRLAERCVSKEPGGRPSMDEVVRVLSKALTTSLVWASSASTISSASHTTNNSAY